MSDQAIELKWEWPAGRHIEAKMLIDVQKMSKASKGFFGIGASSSLANALPDATDVVGTVLTGPDRLMGKRISMRIPDVEAQKLKLGEHAGIGLVGGNTICVCVLVRRKQACLNRKNGLMSGIASSDSPRQSLPSRYQPSHGKP